MKACAGCGFLGKGIAVGTAAWHRAHKAAHLARYPQSSLGTIAALDQLIRIAASLEVQMHPFQRKEFS